MVGSCQSLTPSDRPGRSFTHAFTSWPRLGSSIGVEGEQGSGTLGGFFTLHCHGNVHKGILTNAHVVQPPISAAEDVRMAADRAGTKYSPPCLSSIAKTDLTKTNVRYFAAKDVIATKGSLESEALAIQENIHTLNRSIEANRDMGLEPRVGANRRKEDLQSMLAKLNIMRQSLAQMPMDVGNVLISSGKGLTSQNRILDWAFVEVLPENSDKFDTPDRNQLPLEMAAGLYLNNANTYNPHLTNYSTFSSSASIEGFGKIEKGQWYFKVGRTTDITTGVCHGTEAYVKMPDVSHRTQYDDNGIAAEAKEVDFTEEYIILNSKSAFADEQKDFCQPEDSGALIIDVEKRVAGLLFGSLSGECGPTDPGLVITGCYYNAGMVTSMPDILSSIAAWTTPRSRSGQPTGPAGFLSLP